MQDKVVSGLLKTSMINKIQTPTFFCVGAQKAGTTALHNYLARHPQIFLPTIKETHFFNNGHGEWPLGYAHYLEKYFQETGEFRSVGEVDPEYLFFEDAAARIANHIPDAKLIFIFREPVSRAYSHYWMIVRRGQEKLNFEQAIEKETERMAEGLVAASDYSYVSRGYYYRQLQVYLNLFPKTNMLFLLSDDLYQNPEATLDKIYQFIGVDTIPYSPMEEDKSNQAAMPISMGLQDFMANGSLLKSLGKALLPTRLRRYARDLIEAKNRRAAQFPSMPISVRQALNATYQVDIKALENVIGRDLTAWLK